jgi:N-acetylmuramoyl-L-alanine amidase
VGYAARTSLARQTVMAGARIAVDVQHLYRPSKPHDRGALFTLADGTHTDEASATLKYAAVLCDYLEASGATVLTNDAAHGILTGEYRTRNRAAQVWQAHAYLACHLDAGGGEYAMVERMAMTAGGELAEILATAVSEAFPRELPHHQVRLLGAEQRGAVCVEAVPATIPALILEPFFGDQPNHQGLLAAPQLRQLGVALGSALARWWQERPE